MTAIGAESAFAEIGCFHATSEENHEGWMLLPSWILSTILWNVTVLSVLNWFLDVVSYCSESNYFRLMKLLKLRDRLFIQQPLRVGIRCLAMGRREQVNGRHSTECDYYLCNFILGTNCRGRQWIYFSVLVTVLSWKSRVILLRVFYSIKILQRTWVR